MGTFGITDYAQKNLGDVVYIETPTVGDQLQAEGKKKKIIIAFTDKINNNKTKDQAGVVESVKAASDIYSPVSGKVVEVNEALADEPSLINTSPESEGKKESLLYRLFLIIVIGWLAKIQLSNTKELDALLDETTYKSFCSSSEEH